MSVQFPAQLYSNYRPLYPKASYELLSQWIQQLGLSENVSIAEVGCGAGQFSAGLVQSENWQKLYLIEPDSEMLNAAQEMIARFNFGLPAHKQVEWIVGPGQKTGLPDHSIDVICCASAFHWMPKAESQREFLRILKRPGLIVFYEYGFPRSAARPEFDQWVRGQFQGEWQIPQLRERRSFREMVEDFGQIEGVRDLGLVPILMTQEMGWRDLYGLLRTQSRYIHFRQSLSSEQQREQFDRDTEATVHALLGEDKETYDYRLLATGFVYTR